VSQTLSSAPQTTSVSPSFHHYPRDLCSIDLSHGHQSEFSLGGLLIYEAGINATVDKLLLSDLKALQTKYQSLLNSIIPPSVSRLSFVGHSNASLSIIFSLVATKDTIIIMDGILVRW